jgi:excisionase family DNA binding protein
MAPDKKQKAIDPTKAISLPEAAKRLGISERGTKLAVQDGRINGMKVGRNYIVDPASLGGYVAIPPGRKPPLTVKRVRRATKS